MRIFVNGCIALVLLALVACAVSCYAYLKPLPYAAQTIVIPPHSGARATLAILHQAGLTPSASLIALPVVVTRANRYLKAGEYEFAAGMSPSEIIGKIARGEIVVHKIAFPEGWNIFQVRDALNKEPLLTGELPADIAEGSIFPDTIHFTRGENRAAVLARMQRARDTALIALWNARPADTFINTPEEALILASVVERETGIGSERPLIAGVFINRLKLGMPLQSDPTVAYGIVVARRGVAMDRPLSSTDLRTDTVYNSYTRTGLPPTPICNPGREAIAAVLNPTPTDALYFVATGQGGHNFAATLSEHTRNVELYRKTTAPQMPEPTVAVKTHPRKRRN